MKPDAKNTSPQITVLLDRLRDGDDAAFRELYLLYYDRLMNYGFRLVENRDLVHDAIQELFIWLFQNPHSLRKIQNPDTYLFKSLRRSLKRSVGQGQQAAQRVRSYSVPDEKTAGSHEDEMIRKSEYDHRRQWLKQQIAHLSKHQQEVIFLRFFENMEYEEIAEIFSVSVQTVRNAVFRALKNLRKNTRRFEWFLLFGLHYLFLQLF